MAVSATSSAARSPATAGPALPKAPPLFPKRPTPAITVRPERKDAWEANSFMRLPFAALSHQGGALEHAQNSLAGLTDAVKRGMVPDVDLHRSADGKLVMHHDPAVQGLEIAKTPWSRLSQVRVKAPDGSLQPLATFEQFLAKFPNQPVSVEVKSMEAAEALVDLVKRRPEVKRNAVIYAFSDPAIRYVRAQLGKDAVTGLSESEGRRFILYTLLPGASDLWKFKTDGDIVAPPLNTAELGLLEQVPWLSNQLIPSERFVRIAHENGLKVLPWTIDDKAQMHTLIANGVDGIYSDSPSILENAVKTAAK